MVGAEGVVENGGVINKLGTYQIAVCAQALNKPFYVAAGACGRACGGQDARPGWGGGGARRRDEPPAAAAAASPVCAAT